jgi:hypothetical protein
MLIKNKSLYNEYMTDGEYRSLEVDAASLYLLRKQRETQHQLTSDLLKFFIITIPIIFSLVLFIIFK